MADRPPILIDPHFRRMDEIFSPADRDRLHGMVEVIWGKDEPMPADAAVEALHEAVAVVCSGWHYGDTLETATKLRAIIDVSGGWPDTLDYDRCFERRIRVLSAAPAFGRQVAEMALVVKRQSEFAPSVN